jgi:trans-aconitate 2-methyltransferase
MANGYLFGDSDVAARRLKLLTDCFAASSRAFGSEAVDGSLELAVDLGCGPGYTTHLLADALACERVIGLDNSEHYIELARRSATERVGFRLHDVTVVPFPDGACDLISVRFLLTHQPDAASLLEAWATQLHSGGRLLVEETESIYTTNDVFAAYISIVQAMLAERGLNLYVGRDLAVVEPPPGLRTYLSRTAQVPVRDDLTARMFSLNTQSWKDDAFVTSNYPAASIDQLERALRDLGSTPSEKSSIEWQLRQIVFRQSS